MIKIQTVNSNTIEVLASNTAAIDVCSYGDSIKIHIHNGGLTHLSIEDVIELKNAIQQALDIANEFDYCLEKYKT